MSAAELIWGQRVEFTDERHACYGRVGRYEGVITGDALRVRFPGGVIVASISQLCATPEHPVCVARRLKRAGVRAPRADLNPPAPDCYVKDYGKTAAERAADAWATGLESDDPETFRSLWDDMQRAHFAERWSRKPRRLRPADVQKRKEGAADKRWLRTRKALRARATGSPAA